MTKDAVTADRWQQVSQIYLAARERDTADRDAFVREACAGDEGLRREIESLLGYEGAADPWIERPAVAVAAPMLNDSASSSGLTGRQVGPYTILALLGAGGMGEVYHARDARLGRDVAIKILPPDVVADANRTARFAREARLLAALNHPYIAQIYGLEQLDPSAGLGHPGGQALVMELVPGETLAALLKGRRHALMVADALALARQIADALEAAHNKGIVHRDLKPANIKVTPEGIVKILDFGLAKVTERISDAEPQLSEAPQMTADGTRQGVILGTAAYMSPEQARGQQVDKRTDIWAFGCVIYEMLTGRGAYAGDTMSDTIAKILEREPEWAALPDRTPASIRRLLQRCLRKDPARRLHDIADARIEIEEALGLAVPIDDVKTASETRYSASRSVWRVVRIAALLAAGVGVGFLASRMMNRPVVPVPPSVVPLTSLPGNEQMSSLSPDGNQVAFSWDGERGDNTDIYVLPVAGAGDPLRLTTDPAPDTAPAWSPDGSQIAFVRRHDLRAAVHITTPVPSSDRRLTEVNDTNGRATLSWFPDGKRLAISDSGGQRNGILAIPVDGGESKRLLETPASAGMYLWPTVSPSGGLLAYARCVSIDVQCDVYVLELAQDLTVKGEPRQLTWQRGMVYGIAWTADSSSIIYGLGPYTKPSLWRLALAGGRPDRVELAGDHSGFPALAGGTNKLAFTRFDPGADIWKLDGSGPQKTFLSSTLDDRNAQFSGDGKKIAFESNRLGKDSQIWVANADGTTPVPINDGATGLQGSPRFSPDSSRIVHDAQGEDGRQGVYTVDAAGGQSRLLTKPGGVPSWSRDGKWIYFASGRTGTREIWRVPAAGGSAEQVSDNGGTSPLESPNGEIYYIRNVRSDATVRLGNSAELFRKPLRGGQGHPILDSLSGTLWAGARDAGLSHKYVPFDDGIYYISLPDQGFPLRYEVRFLSFATRTHQTVDKFEARSALSLSVSPDRKTFLVSGAPMLGGSDLKLIANFR